jgi:flagellar biosynthesis/type III secretory pathway chaperone
LSLRTENLPSLVASQRNAIIARDALAVESSTTELMSALQALRQAAPPLSDQEKEVIQQVEVATLANAQILQQAIGLNARLLGTLLDTSSGYGATGALTATSRGSRRLGAA